VSNHLWPSIRTLHHALARGMTLVVDGQRRVSSSSPHVWWGTDGVVCERCGACVARLPPPPKGPTGPLFTPASREYAGFVAAVVLYPFLKAHAACGRKENE
jgi:hypothetical protein